MDMWALLAASLAAGAVFSYAPGYFVLRALRLDRLTSLVVAPVVSFAAYALVGIVYSRAGIFCSWASVFLPVLIVSALAAAVSSFALRGRARPDFCIASGDMPASMSWACLGVYIAFGVVATIIVFYSQIQSPEAIHEWVDNVHHLSQARNFLDSGIWSPFDVYMYKAPGEAAFDPYPGGGFYPSTWHILAAMVAGATGAPIPVAFNALIGLCTAVIFPSCAFLFVRLVCFDNVRACFMGAALALSCSTFPWGFAMAGPLYPNLLAFSIVPAAVVCFIAIFRRHAAPASRVVGAICTAISLVSLAFAHPNAVFTLAVVLIPFCAYHAGRIVRSLARRAHLRRSRRVVLIVAAAVAFLVVAAFIWLKLYNLPFLAEVVSYNWPSFTSVAEAVTNAFTFNFRETVPNAVFSVCTMAGVAYTLYRRDRLWLSFSLLFAFLLYIVAASTEGVQKFVLAGFWYTDFYRLGANAVICAVPLAALGLSAGTSAFVAAVRAAVSNSLARRGDAAGSARAGDLTCELTEEDIARMREAQAPLPAACPPASQARSGEARAAGFEEAPFSLGDTTGLPWSSRRSFRLVCAGALFAVAIAASVLPLSSAGGYLHSQSQYGVAASRFASEYTYRGYKVYNAIEASFVRDVMEVLPEGAVVINEPNDGSMFAYGTEGLPIMYRYIEAYSGGNATEEGLVIRQRLCDIASDEEVRDAVAATGAMYVLQLDQGGERIALSDRPLVENRGTVLFKNGLFVDELGHYVSDARFVPLYDAADWTGVDAIDDDTPGFEIVLSRGDMRLYRITALEETA